MILEAVMEWERPTRAEDEIVKLRRGDPDTLAALVSRYQHRLYRYLLRLAREPATAEDLFQQTWLKVVENIRRFDAGRSFDTWLFAIAHNVAIDHLRRRQPESLHETVPLSTGPDAYERVLAGERARMLAAGMAALPTIYREVLTLRFEEDLKLEEVAEVTQVPLSTAKSRLRRALEALRERLESRQ